MAGNLSPTDLRRLSAQAVPAATTAPSV